MSRTKRFLEGGMRLYSTKLEKYPILVNCSTGFGVASIGDLVAQIYLSKKSKKGTGIRSWDAHRAIEMGVIRAGFITPFILLW